MGELRFSEFTKKIYIDAPRNKLYWAWSTKAGIESWFLRKASYSYGDENERQSKEYVQPGDRYTWEWHNWEGQEKGTILKANGSDFLEFSFANDSCTVSVLLQEEEDSVLVTLRQYNMPTDEKTKMEIYNGCSCGWTFWMANLKAYLEYGILLNETKVDLKDVPQAGHIFVNM